MLSKLMLRIFILSGLIGMFSACGENNSNTANTESSKDTVVADIQPQELAVDADYVLDTSRTVIRWVGSKPTDSHIGEVKARRGVLQRAGVVFVGGVIELDMNSITCEDITDDAENAKLVSHLKGEDFFDVKEFPVSRLQVLNMNLVEDGMVSIGAELTIKGITQNIESELVMNERADTITVLGDFIFDRTLYDIKYKSKSIFPDLADKFINDEISIEVNAVFVKQ